MIKTGLVSISFRKLSPDVIIDLVARAGLDGIEWGGDIHVPHGDTAKAREVAQKTRDAGLCIPSYGSYYYLGCEKEKNLPFEKVLESALELGTPLIRVWAGNRASSAADQDWWNTCITDARRIGQMALEQGVKIAFEYHANTLTDTSETAYRLLKETNHPNIYTYWQPPVGMTKEECIEGLNKIIPWLTNVHTFYWVNRARRPLEEGIDVWIDYMKVIKQAKGDRYSMIEFVKDDTPEQFLKDSEALKKIVG
ncbi:MAG: sugar phosphate isomerase/epimerase [Clostridiaceae bacterium]|jgi:3-dehydroshikimate dehydratase|nr:sugar phosphate isomerase/epimerase [Clostridiaceae bacterium]